MPCRRICGRALRLWTTIRNRSAWGATSPDSNNNLKQTKTEPTPKTDSADWTRAAQQWERFRSHGLDLRRSARAHHRQRRPGLAALCVAGNRVCRRRGECAAVPQPGPGARPPRLTGVQRSRGTRHSEGPGLAGKRFARLEPLRCALCAVGRRRRIAGNFAGTSEATSAAGGTFARFDLAPILIIAVAAARQRLPGLAPQFMDRLGPMLQLRQQVQQRIGADRNTDHSDRSFSSLSHLGAPSCRANL